MKKIFLKSSISIFELVRIPSGDTLYFSHSASQSSLVNGGRIPVIGCHSTILRPDSVSRVSPPMTMIPKTRAEQPNSQYGSERGMTTGGEASPVGNGGMASAAPAPAPEPAAVENRWEGVKNVEAPWVRWNEGVKKRGCWRWWCRGNGILSDRRGAVENNRGRIEAVNEEPEILARR